MELDLKTSLQISKFIGGIVLDDFWTLLVHLLMGMLIGTVIAFLIYRLIKSKGWFKRTIASSTKRFFLWIFRASFYLSLIGLSSTIALVIGSNKIVQKEITNLVDEGLSYCQTNYFSNFENIESAFAITDQVYAAGYDVNQANHLLSEAMVDMISEKYGLGFLGSYLFASPKHEMVKEIEDLERQALALTISYGLEKIGAGDIIEPEDIDKAFYAWLNNDKGEGLGSMNTFLSTQICYQVKPLIFSIWLPFLIIFGLFIIANAIEVVLFYYRINKGKTPTSLPIDGQNSIPTTPEEG
jgi:hypothetical protein